jgi:RNA polymerase sigma factor (sigma-70 family)
VTLEDSDWLAQRFEENRGHLRGVAYRMLGSLGEAEDAVQEAWLRFSRADTSAVENLGGWLTTVVARVCLDMLRARKSRREEELGPDVTEMTASQADETSPEKELLLADSVGLALLVVLETLAPAERLAFVLHDLFAMPFDEIAPIVGRSATAARQLASRARRRVQGTANVPSADLTRQREVVEAFLAAARAGDFEGLLAVLDPDVVRRLDAVGAATGAPLELRGAAAVAKGALGGSQRARKAPVDIALVDGSVGLVVAPRGRLSTVIVFKVSGARIVEMDVIADPRHLRQLRLAVLTDSTAPSPPPAGWRR